MEHLMAWACIFGVPVFWGAFYKVIKGRKDDDIPFWPLAILSVYTFCFMWTIMIFLQR